MSLEIDVLRALLRLARRRSPPTLAQVVTRVGGDEAAVRRALRTLARSGLVQRAPAGVRLSLPGLAVAVACARRSPVRSEARPAEVAVGAVPLVSVLRPTRRKRAA